MIQNLKGGHTEESKARMAKFNKALGMGGDKRTRKKGQGADKRVRRAAPRSGGGDMGLASQIIDQDTGGLSEFGAKLRATAPSVRAAMERLKMGDQQEIDDPTIKGKSLQQRPGEEAESETEDSDFDDDDDALAAIRRQRVNELKVKSKLNEEWLKRGHGKYTEIVEEDFLPMVTKSKHVLCHFYHKDFERCKIMDKHLHVLARKHLCAHFLYINAEKCPFFVKKLQIRMLPTVICFVDGVAKDRVVGFSDLGNKDDFETIVLERRLAESGCIPKPPKEKKGIVYGAIRSRKEDDEDDYDFDT
eukprot:CAMPEP_0114513148 /NCGR_PEP_ID=MMETSP0109-20121206/15395_1 /TAXON_ID=29199 /ORGANISM="Chlorarachnion reptans, Strain CCCM449" /LENGTH=302 /DNA_ID=CAMNT_0001692961 /DNA_START=249 /DNA_END=1157 /DNA_ORIENTATION=+